MAKKIGPPIIIGGKPLSIDNMFKIQQSQWKTKFVDQSGNVQKAAMTIDGDSGSYTIAGGGTGLLSSITYDNTFEGTPTMVTFSFSGDWTLGGQSGQFEFENGDDQNLLDGRWSSAAGASGTWTGKRVDAQTAINDF